jgi:hypothetical protein
MHDWERPPKRSDRRLSGVRGSQLPRAVSGRPLMELQALQRTAGNAAVARLVAQRMDAQHTVAQRVQAQTAAVNTTEEDREILLNYRNETQNPAVQALLDELFAHLERVSFEQTAGSTGGSTRHLGDGQYSVSYARPADMDTHDRIAVLVHELTHVGINEAYNSDMLNYPVPVLTDTERMNTMEETPGREEDIQNARMRKVEREQRDSFIDHVMGNVTLLLSQLPGSGLSSERQTMIDTKLRLHTLQRPFHEYDAVLSHLLTWCDRDGADQSSEFYRSLTTMVAQAAAWRASGAITVPETAPGPGPAPALASPAGGGTSRRTGGKSGRKLRDRVKDVLNKLARIFRRR